MDPRLRARVEIDTIHELLPLLSHYQLLQLTPDAVQADVDAAFRTESRRLHPDRHTAGATPEQRTRANEVFKGINEAYRVLRDPDSRAAYDAELKGGARGTEARKTAEIAIAAAKDPSKAARTPKGERYWKLAMQAWGEENYVACAMNCDFALTFEGDNEIIKEWRTKAKALAEGQKKSREGDGYKIRL